MESKNTSINILFVILSALLFVGAIVTLIPFKGTDDECIFGYFALCPFSPWSSLILIVLAAILFYFRKKETQLSKN
jgi:hypothetical protein